MASNSSKKQIVEQSEKSLKCQEKEVEESNFDLPEVQFDKTNLTQEFYKNYQRQFSQYILLKHGHRICRVQREEEDLSHYCFSLLQAEAKFPIKIFMIDYGKNMNTRDINKSNLKMFWLETSVMVSGITFSPEKQLNFEKTIYNFFKDYLLPQLQNFMKDKINWDSMILPEYTDEKVIAEFKKEIIEAANKQFACAMANV